MTKINPTAAIIKLSKAFEYVHASESDPDRPCYHPTLPTQYILTNKQMKESQKSTRNSWRETRMTGIHPTAILNWVRLLTMSKHPNQIQKDRFCPTAAAQCILNNKQIKELHELTRNSWLQTNHLIHIMFLSMPPSADPYRIMITRFFHYILLATPECAKPIEIVTVHYWQFCRLPC